MVIIAGAGAAVPFVLNFIPENKPTRLRSLDRPSEHAVRIALGPSPDRTGAQRGGLHLRRSRPRLITVTHHDAIAGPYHRNWRQIVDVMNAFRGSEAQARQIIVDKYHSNYVLSCPNSSTTTIFMSETPKGFYGQLQRGKVPTWLQPVPLPKDSPYQMWKVVD